jgi:uncharacterized protein
MTLDKSVKAIMETSSGKMINILDPLRSDIDIKDIAHSLANQCRYGGHCRKFLSVAEHSVKVARAVEEEWFGTLPEYYGLETDPLEYKAILMALLHDASEAYLVDIPTPIKAVLADYKEIENNLMNEIFSAFGIDILARFNDMPEYIHWGDKYMLFQEAYDAVPSKGLTWNSYRDMCHGKYPKEFKPRYWKPRKAKRIFLREFRRLTGTMTRVDKFLYYTGFYWI